MVGCNIKKNNERNHRVHREMKKESTEEGKN